MRRLSDMKTHGKFLKLINVKLDDRLTGEQSRMLEEHLASCAACRAEFEALSEIRGILLSASDAPLDPEAAGRQASRIMDLVRAKPSSTGRAGIPLPLKPALGLASVIVILILSFALLQHPGGKGAIPRLEPGDPFNDNLVWVLNQHELMSGIEAFNEPWVVLGEIDVNERSLLEAEI